MFWHYGSSLGNHDHILMMVGAMYDPGVYLTDEKYLYKFGETVNIQSIIEKPNLYILARCPSNDQQLLYDEERVDDLIKPKTNSTDDNGTGHFRKKCEHVL